MGQLPGSLARLNTGSKARCAVEGWTEGGEHTLNLCLVLQGWCQLWSQGSILHRAKHLAYIQANTLSSKLQNAPVTSEAISSKDEEVKAASQQQPCDAFAKLQHVPESFEHTLLSPMSFTSPEFTLHLTCTACVHSHCLYSEQGTALWWGAERAANFSCTPWERRRGHSPHADSPRHTSDLQLQVAGCLQIALSQCFEGLSPFIYSYLIRDELSEPGAAFHWVFRGALVSGVSTWGQEVPIRCLARGCALLSASPPGGANDFFSLYSLHAQRLPREPGKRDRETEERHLLPTALPQLLLTPNSCDTLYSPSRWPDTRSPLSGERLPASRAGFPWCGVFRLKNKSLFAGANAYG